MQWTCTKDNEAVRLTIRGVWRWHDLLHLLGAAALLVILRYAVERRIDLLIARCVVVLWLLALVVRRLVERDVMSIYTDRIELYRNGYGIGHTKTFLRSDVEGIGFVPDKGEGGCMLGIRDRLHIFAIPFAHGISSDEASEVLAKIESFGTWLNPMIHQVGTPLFAA